MSVDVRQIVGSGECGKPDSAGQHDDTGHGCPDGTGGTGAPGEDSDGHGPQAGESSGNMGSKPAWAQEGIPEVELGRFNVARPPSAFWPHRPPSPLVTTGATACAPISVPPSLGPPT